MNNLSMSFDIFEAQEGNLCDAVMDLNRSGYTVYKSTRRNDQFTLICYRVKKIVEIQLPSTKK